MMSIINYRKYENTKTYIKTKKIIKRKHNRINSYESYENSQKNIKRKNTKKEGMKIIMKI